MSRRDTPLYRETDDRKIAGVCGGLARYFDVDPVLVRVLFVVTLFVGGWSLLAYALLWWLVDPAPDGEADAPEFNAGRAEDTDGADRGDAAA